MQSMSFKLGLTVDLYIVYIRYAHARSDDFDLDARSQLVGRGKQSALNDRQLGKQCAFNLLQQVGHYLYGLDFEHIHMA